MSRMFKDMFWFGKAETIGQGKENKEAQIGTLMFDLVVGSFLQNLRQSLLRAESMRPRCPLRQPCSETV